MILSKLKIPSVVGAACLGILAVISFFGKIGDAISVPRRVEALERAQADLSKRIDGLTFDVQKVQSQLESSFRNITDALSRAETRAADGAASLKSMASALNEIQREEMKSSARIESLQIQQDRFEERLTKP